MENRGAKIKVVGVGGGGNNAVNQMVKNNLEGADFYIANTDNQALEMSPVLNKMVLGELLTKGLGAGADPAIGKKAAIESEHSIRDSLSGADMVFIAVGLGGGTGTGAAPIIAKAAKDNGSLVVAIATTPFSFEGKRRTAQAVAGLEELRECVDSVIIVSNEKLLETVGNIPMMDAFKESDKVLQQGVQTITDLISVPTMVNLDFADVRSVMASRGDALIGVGKSKDENKAVEAAKKAVSSPLLESKIQGARDAIVNVTGGPSMSLMDASDAVDTIREHAGTEIDIIFGVAINESLGDEVIVTVIATGFEEDAQIVYKRDHKVVLESPNLKTKQHTKTPSFFKGKEDNVKESEEVRIPNFNTASMRVVSDDVIKSEIPMESVSRTPQHQQVKQESVYSEALPKKKGFLSLIGIGE